MDRIAARGGRMITPYYDHAGVTLYVGDCREILPALGDGILVQCDFIAVVASA
jgi:hypothetical protein